MTLRVNSFTLNNKREITDKIVREVLVLFKVEVVGRRGEADFAQLSVVNRRLPDTETGLPQVESELLLFDLKGHVRRFVRRRPRSLRRRRAAWLGACAAHLHVRAARPVLFAALLPLFCG